MVNTEIILGHSIKDTVLGEIIANGKISIDKFRLTKMTVSHSKN